MKGIQLDPETWDLKITSGALTVGNTTVQNQALIMHAEKGEFKEDPFIGVGSFVNEHDSVAVRKEIIAQMERDGQRVKKCKVTDRIVELDAEYR